MGEMILHPAVHGLVCDRHFVNATERDDLASETNMLLAARLSRVAATVLKQAGFNHPKRPSH